jgi:hypothetical protein
MILATVILLALIVLVYFMFREPREKGRVPKMQNPPAPPEKKSFYKEKYSGKRAYTKTPAIN